ncbi:MAG: hypothetical protein KBD53_10495 [Candidatus Omnitrophica bacterium]|nr:hypothetical protein [Candidatus Omnitrophota bacterium]
MKRKFIFMFFGTCLFIAAYYFLSQPVIVKPKGLINLDADQTQEHEINEVITNQAERQIQPEQEISEIPTLVQKKLTYEAYDIDTNNTIDQTMAYITEQTDGKKIVQWFLEKKDYAEIEEYVLNDRWETESWSARLPNEGSDYKGIRKGNTLELRGKFKNKELTRRIQLNEDLPFYFNPKLGLKGFVLSKAEKMEFWGLRTDELTEFKMKAEKKGVAPITVDGKTFDALKIYWAATGIGEKFFNRTYYYRLSDAEFVTQDPSDKWKMKLIAVETSEVPENEQRITYP